MQKMRCFPGQSAKGSSARYGCICGTITVAAVSDLTEFLFYLVLPEPVLIKRARPAPIRAARNSRNEMFSHTH